MMIGMLNRFSIVVCGLVLSAVVGLVLLTACQPQQKPTATGDPLACGPDLETLVVANDFVAKAIASAGGCKAWLNTRKLDLDCIVTFYDSTGGFYLTQQHHEIYPWSDSVRISAAEPLGEFTCLLSQDSFTPAEVQVQYDVRDFIYAVRAVTTAPVRFLDGSIEFSKPSKPVKMQGLWYYPIEARSTPAPNGVEGSDEPQRVVFYQNRDTSLVDIISFIGSDSSVIASEAQPSVAIPISLLVRGYDYRKVKPTAVFLPTRIEIFSTNPAGIIQHRLLKIDYFNLW
jgi:hypothetical protein